MSEAESCIKRICSHKGVKLVLIIDSEGRIIRAPNADPETEQKYASLISELVKKTKGVVRELDANDGLTFMRIRTGKEEIMIAPDKVDSKYNLIVVQDPKNS